MFDCVEVSFGQDNLLIAFDGNRLHDLLLLGDGSQDIGAIYLAKVDRPIKGLGGVFVSLGNGEKGFWRVKNPPREGALVPLQIVQTAMRGKPVRMSDRIDYRGTYIVLTPDRAGVNLSRQWQGDRPEWLAKFETMLPENCGAILRTIAEDAPEEVIISEASALVENYRRVAQAEQIGLVSKALTGRARAELEWGVKSFGNRLEAYHKDAIHDALDLPLIAAGGEIRIESTHALIAVDIDTGANTAPSAGKDVNTRAVARIVDWLHKMGWGGQLVVDPAPMPMQARKGFEGMMQKAAKGQGLELTSRGFGPLGLYEAQIRYARRPLEADILAQLELLK